MVETHGALMDQVYRRQRFLYDATRKYYLLGRDHTLRQLQAKDGAHILEVACGTGRNLDKIDRLYPQSHLYGLDISSEMLLSARRKMGDRAKLAQADACAFDPARLFGQTKFDHIVMSYCVSMIPGWQSAIETAASHLAPKGTLHIVDFGDQSRLPRWFDRGLRAWLARFHVTPRDEISVFLPQLKAFDFEQTSLFRSYATYVSIRNAAPGTRAAAEG